MSHSLASHLAVAFPLGHRGLKSSGVADPPGALSLYETRVPTPAAVDVGC